MVLSASLSWAPFDLCTMRDGDHDSTIARRAGEAEFGSRPEKMRDPFYAKQPLKAGW